MNRSITFIMHFSAIKISQEKESVNRQLGWCQPNNSVIK